MAKVGAAVTGLILITLIGGLYFFINYISPESISTKSSPTAEPADSKQIAPSPILPQPNPSSVEVLKMGGSSYSDPQAVFSFLYPGDFVIGEDGDYTRIYRWGPTQKGQTEMYDGILMMFRAIELDGQRLSEWVDKDIERVMRDGVSTMTQPKRPYKLKSYEGFSYSFSGLGEFHRIIVQKSADSSFGVEIIYFVEDPTGRGFLNDVSNILTSLEIMK